MTGNNAVIPYSICLAFLSGCSSENSAQQQAAIKAEQQEASKTHAAQEAEISKLRTELSKLQTQVKEIRETTARLNDVANFIEKLRKAEKQEQVELASQTAGQAKRAGEQERAARLKEQQERERRRQLLRGLLTSSEERLMQSVETKLDNGQLAELTTSERHFTYYGSGSPFLRQRLIDAFVKGPLPDDLVSVKDRYGLNTEQLVEIWLLKPSEFQKHVSCLTTIQAGAHLRDSTKETIRSNDYLFQFYAEKYSRDGLK